MNIQKKFEDPEMQRVYEETMRKRAQRTKKETDEDRLVDETEKKMTGVTSTAPKPAKIERKGRLV